ncbi:MAG: leucine-rich repeat protein [Muribaculaceae bacterium]|nr:leucine-rich repeat protein [Muribaculaceae bacterium]
MKKSILILFLIALCVNQIQADNTFSYNGFTYEITSTTNLTVKIIRKSLGPTGYTGEVNIPETVPYSGKNFTVTEIGDYIFVDAVQLTKVTIPKTVLSIGRQVFNHCTSLQEIKVDSLNPSFCELMVCCILKTNSY